MSDKLKDLTFAEVANALGTFTGKLDDPNLRTDILDASVSDDLSLFEGDLTLKSGGHARISLFNEMTDEDSTGIFGETENDSDQDTASIPPLLQLEDGEALLKYDVGAGWDVGGTLSNLGFKLGTDGGLSLMCYRRHQGEMPVLEAIGEDLNPDNFIKPYKLADIKRLKVGEAAAMTVRGALGAGIEVEWSKVISSGISWFAKLLKPGNLVALDFGASVSASFDLKLEDDFTLVYSRPENGRLLVSVKKAETSNATGSVGLAVKVAFSDNEGLKQALQSAVAGLLGEEYAKIQAVLNKPDFAALDDAGKALVKRGLQRINVPDESLDLLQQFIAGFNLLQSSAMLVINKIINFKLGLGFAYDYSRIQSDTVLMQASLPDAQLDNYHRDLLSWNLTRLMADAENGLNDLELKTYFRTQSLKVKHGWGFSLYLGFATFGGKDSVELNPVIVTDKNGDKKISFQGTRGYKDSENRYQWKVDLKAQMKTFEAQPKSSDFDLGLAFKLDRQDIDGTRGNFLAFLDQALKWGIVTNSNRDETIQLLEATLGGIDNLAVSYELALDHGAFVTLLPKLGQNSQTILAGALAEAMPYLSKYELRRTPEARRELYTKYWNAWFQGDSAQRIRNGFQRELRDHASLRGFETRDEPLPLSFLGWAKKHEHVEECYQLFAAGAVELERGVDHTFPSDGSFVADAFKKMMGFWGQTLYLDALAIMIRDAASKVDLGVAFQRNMTITYQQDGQEKTLTIGCS